MDKTKGRAAIGLVRTRAPYRSGTVQVSHLTSLFTFPDILFFPIIYHFPRFVKRLVFDIFSYMWYTKGYGHYR